MKNLILCSHGPLAESLKASTEMIVGEQSNIYALSLLPEEDIDSFREKFKKTTEFLEQVVVFVDIPGGTPANTMIRELLEGKNIQVYTGMNLPMVLSFVNENLTDIQSDYLADACQNTFYLNDKLFVDSE